jgi:pyrroline-5-carboxylate reductase
MPNLAASVGEGATVAFAEGNYGENQRGRTCELLEAVGLLEWLPSEHLIDVATGLSGSGPAYVFYFADCLTQAGIAAGLEAGTAERLARATVSGAGLVLKTSSKSAAQLRSDVTSPAGTTEAGLKVLLSEGQLQKMVCATVEAASTRASELSGAIEPSASEGHDEAPD